LLKKLENLDKTICLSYEVDKLYHINLYRIRLSPRTGNKITSSSVIGTNYIGRHKSYYCTVTLTTALNLLQVPLLLYYENGLKLVTSPFLINTNNVVP